MTITKRVQEAARQFKSLGAGMEVIMVAEIPRAIAWTDLEAEHDALVAAVVYAFEERPGWREKIAAAVRHIPVEDLEKFSH